MGNWSSTDVIKAMERVSATYSSRRSTGTKEEARHRKKQRGSFGETTSGLPIRSARSKERKEQHNSTSFYSKGKLWLSDVTEPAVCFQARLIIGQCGGLDENRPHRVIHLNASSPVSGTV